MPTPMTTFHTFNYYLMLLRTIECDEIRNVFRSAEGVKYVNEQFQ